MAEKQQVAFVQPTPVGKEELGKIEVAPEVIEVIAGIAATEVDGIAATRGNFASVLPNVSVKKFIRKASSQQCLKKAILSLMYFAQ